MKLDVNELTYLINGAIFEVNHGLGGGFLEKVYENALLAELNERGLSA
jgi:GxxExxY protein